MTKTTARKFRRYKKDPQNDSREKTKTRHWMALAGELSFFAYLILVDVSTRSYESIYQFFGGSCYHSRLITSAAPLAWKP